tara:strand:- start:930 stop:2597 length:1668 start_codon:yes stop_codon:yes gene_type:complete
MDIKKVHKGLIDATGRRKYFRQLNPVLLGNPVEIDIKLIKKKQKVLFIMPNFHWIDEDVNALWDLLPWNLCQMAAMIEGICSDVKIIDAYKENLSKEQLKQEIKKFKPDIVGLTVLMDQYGEAAHIAANIVKNVSKNIINVIGGVYVTANPKRIMIDKNFDYVVMGEGEYVFQQIVGFYSNACDLPERGICFRKNSNGDVENRGHAAFIKNLDALPKPAYHLIDLLSYTSRFANRRSADQPGGYPYARIITSRGCPEKCSFCQVPSLQGSYFRARSPDNVCDEIEWLKKEYGIKAILFDDDNMFTNMKRGKALLRRMIDRGLSMPWTSIATAVFRLDNDMVDLMVESGCTYIDVAIESGTERVTRDIILKPINFKQAKTMVAYARKKGIFVAANYIIGFPTETWEEIRETIKFSEEINADYTKIFIAIPLRNTEMFDLAQKTKSLIMDPLEADTMWTVGGVIKSDHWSADDLTILRAYEWDRINFTDPKKAKKIADKMGITMDELNNIRKKTLNNARETVSKRQSSGLDSSVKRAADIALVTLQSSLKKEKKKIN